MRDAWERVPLGAVTEQRIDPVELDDATEYRSLGVKWYGAGTFQRDPKLGAEIKASRLFRVAPGQFIYNRLFATEGSFGIVRPEDDGAVVSNEFPVFDLDRSQLLAEYLYLHFQQSAVWAVVAEQCVGTTKSRLRWKEDRLRGYAISLPPVEEQRRIVDLTGALDDTIAAAAQVQPDDVYRQTLRYLENSFPLRPVSELVYKAFAGGTPSRRTPTNFGGSIPWLKSGEVENDHITTSAEFITQAGEASSSARLVPAGSTVVAMYGQGDTKGRAGYVVAPVTTNQAVLALIPDPLRVDSRYLLHAVRARTPSLRSRAVGAAQPNLSKSLVLTEELPVPESLEDQRAWADRLDAMRTASSMSKTVEARLRGLRSNLLTALLSGEHPIPESYDELMKELAA